MATPAPDGWLKLQKGALDDAIPLTRSRRRDVLPRAARPPGNEVCSLRFLRHSKRVPPRRGRPLGVPFEAVRGEASGGDTMMPLIYRGKLAGLTAWIVALAGAAGEVRLRDFRK